MNIFFQKNNSISNSPISPIFYIGNTNNGFRLSESGHCLWTQQTLRVKRDVYI